jgi:hypothetical protein
MTLTRRVVQSDESHFAIEDNDRDARITRKIGKRDDKDHVMSTEKWNDLEF